MSNENSLVLITTAINPPDGVVELKMLDIPKRIITSKAAVFFWSALGVKQIVIADATGQTLLDNSEVQLLNKMGVEVEQINYFQDIKLIIEKGKGQGEGALIKHALLCSKLLQSVSSYYKSTGKVYCRNFIEIFNMIQQNNVSNIFWRDVLNQSIMDTRFFYASKEFSHKFLIPAYENINDRNNIYAEHCIIKVAHDNLTQGTSIRPMLSGFSGSQNQPYFESSLGFLDQNLPCWYSKNT
jgi:hypothetical protein